MVCGDFGASGDLGGMGFLCIACRFGLNVGASISPAAVVGRVTACRLWLLVPVKLGSSIIGFGGGGLAGGGFESKRTVDWSDGPMASCAMMILMS